MAQDKDLKDRVQKAIARGVSVYQGDLETALEDYPDGAFDYAILSLTIQATRQPKIVLEQAKGFSLYMLKAVLSGRGDEIVELARTNLR